MLTRRQLLALTASLAIPRIQRTGPAPRGTKAGDQRTIAGIPFCWCPPGGFTMGSPESQPEHRPDEAQVPVVLTRGFWIAKFETTQGEWQRVAGEAAHQPPSPAFGVGADVPIYWVSFFAAERFSAQLTALARRTQEIESAWEFRLPTEAQWEYACRGGTATATAFGDSLGHDQANFAGVPLNGGGQGDAPRRAVRGGTYPPNAWGICDMHGNVFEWCRDWYHSRLPGGSDPDLHDKKGTPNRDGTYSRVRRGGAWNDDGWACRSALRLRYEPERSSDHIGFRVVLVETR